MTPARKPVPDTVSITVVKLIIRGLRTALTGLVLLPALVLAGCSSGDSGGSGNADGSGGTRTVTDALGEVTVPADPQRVVATDFFSSSMLVDVGVTPVGVMEGIIQPDSRPQRYVDALADAEQLSTYAEIDVEKVAVLEPDLIIVDAAFPEPETIDRLEGIAPLFHVDLTGDWAERALSVADAVGRLDEARAQQGDYDQRAAEISQTYRKVLDEKSLAIVSLNTTDNTWASYAPGGWPTPPWIDVDATFRTPTDGEADTGDAWVWISDEEIGALDNAGMIIVLEKEQLARYRNNPMWQRLPAVQAGNVFDDFPSPATSSFRWGMDNLDTVEGILREVK